MTIFKTKRIRTTFFTGLLALVAFGTTASAAMLETKPGERTIEGVKLAKEAVFKTESGPVTLGLYASGLRKKKVAVFWAKVYVGQIFAAPGLKPPTTLAEARETLMKQPIVAISMTFLRDVGASRVKDGFEDSLEANGMDPNSEELKPLFTIVEKGGDAKDTLPITLVMERRKDGTEWLHYENAKGEIQSTGFKPGVISKLLSIWVGKPADSGMERLQNQFIGKSDD